MPPETVLDCRCFQSALNSCASILGAPPEVLLRALREFEYDAVPESDRRRWPYEELLPKYVCGVVGRAQLPSPQVIHWFHATRVPPGTEFREGILPSSRRLDSIWALLGTLASEWSSPSEWEHFRGSMDGPGAREYHLRTSSRVDDGPHAFLVRDAILHPEQLRSHDYLRMPEIIQDICTSYHHRYQHPLYDRARQATRPCIVTFRSSSPWPDALAAALMYVHRVVRREDLFLHCNTCFDGKGGAVPPVDIVRLEWLDDAEV